MEQLIQDKLKQNNWSVYIKDIASVSDEEFAKARHNTFGASDSSKLLEVNPFPNGKLSDLMNEKINEIVDETISKKPSVRMGKDIEPLILDKATEALQSYVYKPYNMYKDDNSALSVNFDGVVYLNDELIPVEAKAISRFGRKYYDFNKATFTQKDGEWHPLNIIDLKPTVEGNDATYINNLAEAYGIPVYYFTQLQQQILALNSGYGYLIALDVENWNAHMFKIYRDNYTINKLVSLGTAYGIKLQCMKNKKSLGD